MLTREELKGIVQGLETQSVQVNNCSFEMLRWIEDAPKAVVKLLADVEQMQLDLEFERSTNNFDAKRLRVLARVAGCEEGVPDDATAVACAGTVLGMIRRNVEQVVAERDRYKAVIARLEREIKDLQSLVPHPGDGTCDRCGIGGAQAVTVALCEECRDLEREIAYHAARSDIECICVGHYEDGPGSTVWYDLQSPDNDDDRGFIAQAEAYLAARKLLKRHPENQNWVRPLDAETVQG